nr:hypothetical protein [Tanacetum cinerariifolium]
MKEEDADLDLVTCGMIKDIKGSEGSNADSEGEMEVYWINRDYEYVIGPAQTYDLKRRLLKENSTQNMRKAAYKKAFEVWIVLKCTKITKKPDNNCTRR